MEHGVAAPAWAEALEAAWIGVAMRQSFWAYPAANLAHLLGLVLLVGPILLLDLRMLGLGRAHIDAEAASRLLTPFIVVGLALAIATGPLLFVADAKALAASDMLIWKLALIGVALVNAVAFRAFWNGRLSRWDEAPPRLGRFQAGLSIAVWLSVAALGRMIAYL